MVKNAAGDFGKVTDPSGRSCGSRRFGCRVHFVLGDKAKGPGRLRYGALLVILVGLVLLTWKVIEIGKGIKEEAELNELQSCVGRVLVVLDDHKFSEGTYELAVTVEGRDAFRGRLVGVLPHGEPFEGPFTNWTKLPFSVTLTRRAARQASLDSQFQLGGSPNAGDWLGVADIQVDCPDGKFAASIQDLHKYGPGGRPTGILYIGQLKRWAVPRANV
jgi:hypothetical protein